MCHGAVVCTVGKASCLVDAHETVAQHARRIPGKAVESQGLVSVALKNRRLSEIPERLMRGGDRIHDLDLRRNRLQPPALDCLAFFTNLVSVHLAHNGLAELPLSICSLPNLERLFLNDNNLSSLPDEIGKLVKLKVLRICQNQLTALPDTIGECAQLESLVAGSIHGGNRIKRLPASIGQLSKLRELDMSINELEELPDSIGDCAQLESLNLCSNELAALPRAIGRLSKLKELKVANNQLETLPVEIGGLRNLCVLNVRCNRLKSLPGELAWLRASTSLFISENPFCDAADVIADQPDAAAAHRVPSLRHLCGQVILRTGQLQRCADELPDELACYLESARQCTSCRQPYFDKCHKRIEFANLHGHIRVPSVVSLCRPECATGCAMSKKLAPNLSW